MGGPGLIDGEYVDEVDNFLPCKFVIGGVEYYSSENYFQWFNPLLITDARLPTIPKIEGQH